LEIYHNRPRVLEVEGPNGITEDSPLDVFLPNNLPEYRGPGYESFDEETKRIS
jgi:hypothetical protein